jgi:hypothetical protein
MAKNYFNQYQPRLQLPSYDPSMNGNRANGLQELQMGFGEKSFRGDRQGIWLGADSFADAPFSGEHERPDDIESRGDWGRLYHARRYQPENSSA